LTRFSTETQEATIQNGIKNVVSSMNGIEKPSTPSLKRIDADNQAASSTSWKSADAGLNSFQASSDRAKVNTVANKAVKRILRRPNWLSSLVRRISAAPSSGSTIRPRRRWFMSVPLRTYTR
jgi:hypothetical protein